MPTEEVHPLTKEVVESMLQHEILEECLFDPMDQLQQLLSFDFLSDDKKIAYYTLNYRFQEKYTHESFKIRLHCVKGSFLTFLWNYNARMDDEYYVQVEERRIVKHNPNEKEDDKIESRLSSDCPAPLPPIKPLLTKEKILWHVKGLDWYNKKIFQGYCNWHLMRNIQINCRIFNIGLLAFAKLLGRLLLLLPITSMTHIYTVPMPISFMYTYLMVVEACPLVIKITSKTKHIVEGMKAALFNRTGNAPWIQSYYPFWNSSGEKRLCSIFNVDKDFLPIGGYITTQETRTRLIEVIECELGKDGLIGVLECVHPRRWTSIVRFVTLDVLKICEAMLLGAKLPTDIVHNEDYRESLPIIEILGEVEWVKLNFIPLIQPLSLKKEQRGKKQRKSVDTEVEEKPNLTSLVDFRNTCKWGSYMISSTN